MVRQLQLTTRCTPTMVAGSTLTGLLHGRRHTPTPLLLPSRVPKDSTCPWTALALSDSIHPSRKTTYADVLRAPPPRRKRLHRPARRDCRRTLPPSPRRPRRLRRGSWRWQSLVHRLDLLLPPPSPPPTTTPNNPDNFDPITQWLPTLYSVTPSSPIDTHPIHASDYPPPDDDHPLNNIFDTHRNDFDDDDDDDSTNIPPQHPLSIVQPNIPPRPTQTHMDISKICTQNAHGLWCRARDRDGNIIPNCERDTTKLEHLVHRMRHDDIDAWLVQETWLEDDDFSTTIGGYHMFRHNSPIGTTGRDHLFRGVAIILSPRYYLAWRAAGSPSPITTTSSGAFAGRFIGLNLKFDCFDSKGRRVKGKSLSLFLASIYHPCHDAPHEQFLETLTSILQNVPRNSNLIIGADINAKVGHRDCEEFKAVLGPHGPPQRNTRGSNLLSLYLFHELRIENTFFDAPNHTTFANIKDGDKTMIDIFACAKNLHCRVRNCRTIAYGIESDHTAVQLDLVLTSLKRTASTALHRGTTDWRKIATDQPTQQRYNELLETNVDLPDMSYEDFNDAIHKAGAETALIVNSRCEDWFQFNLADLVPPIEERDHLLHTLRSSTDLPPSIVDSMRVQLHCLNKHVKDKVLIAKARWAAHVCSKIHNMRMNPRVAWEYIRLLTGGSTCHHKKKVKMAMKLENGNLATNGKENMEVFGPHFERVFNNHRPVDPTILDDVPQRPTLHEIDSPITFEEVNAAINKLKPGKSPGLNGIPPEAYKAMNAKTRRLVHKYVSAFFEGDADYDGWHVSQCVPVPKSGNLSDPNKWRGVMLMDVCSKIFSSIMNGRAFRLLELHGTRFQFGGTPTIGCQDGLFTLKTLLNAHKNHDLPSFVAFVDLVKAYDTANHDLLLKILEKYGAPPKFIAAIKTMYTDLRVVLKIDKEIQEILQSVGVRQGDNMAPVLFLFLMSAAAETLESAWKKADIEVLTVAHSPDDELNTGCVRGHTPRMYTSRKLTAYEIYQLLYVDDGAFPFPTRDTLIKGLTLVHSHLARFGLEVHIGRDGAPSKTECVFFPPPQFFDDPHSDPAITTGADEPWLLFEDIPPPPASTHTTNTAVQICSPRPTGKQKTKTKKETQESIRQKKIDVKYDALPETQQFDVADGYVTFCRTFKYLGSRISYNLRDDADIEARLAMANQSMGALKEVWRNPHLDTYSKYLLFRAIPMNLLLWGCENWSLRQDLLRRLEVFLHRSIRRILHISITQVQEERIRNDKIRRLFYEIPCVTNMIAARQLGFLGKVVRGPHDAPARRMLTACCQHKRKRGRPYLHNKDVIVRNLRLLFAQIPEVVIDDYGSMKNWFKEASHEAYWTALVRCLLDKQAPLPTRPTEWPPPRRRSPREHPSSSTPQHDTDSANTSDDDRQNDSTGDPPIPSPPRRRPPPPPPSPRRNQPRTDYDPTMVGRSLEHSFKALGLGLGATETEVKVAYRALARIYHPDKHDPAQTGMTHADASEYFKLINNAQAYLCEVL